jgi:hypothetical protein
MVNYFVDLELHSKGGIGNSSRPLNANEFVDKLTTLSNVVFYVKGIKDFGNSLVSVNCNGNSIIAWGPQPWRIKSFASSDIGNIKKLEGGIFDSTSSLTFRIDAIPEICNMYFVSKNLYLNQNSNSTMTLIGSTICTIGSPYEVHWNGSIVSAVDSVFCNKNGASKYMHNNTSSLSFSHCAFELGDSQQTISWNREEIFTNTLSINFDGTQFGWAAPYMPVWDAPKNAFDGRTLYSNIIYPTQPGQNYPSYTDEPVDLWRNARTGIGAGDFSNTPVISVAPEIGGYDISQTVSESADVKFQISAYGIPQQMKFQWYKNDVPLVDNEKYLGVNTNSLKIFNCLLTDAGTYYAIASNGVSPDARSNNMTLTVIEQQDFYVNMNIPGVSGSGTVVDPWSYQALENTLSSIPMGSVIYLKGSYVHVDGTSWGAGVTYKAWDPEINGPWRMKFNPYIGFGLTNQTLDGGILQIESSMGFTEDTILRNMYWIMKGNNSATLNGRTYGCTFVVEYGFNLQGVHTDLVFVNTHPTASVNHQGETLIRCAISSANFIINQQPIVSECQLDWVAPVMPIWDAPKENFLGIYNSITFPPQFGTIPFLNYENDLWGQPRCSIGAGYTEYQDLVWALGFPEFLKLTYTDAQFSVKINKDGKVYFAAVSSGSQPLTPYQIRDGKDSENKTLPVGNFGNLSVLADVQSTVVISNLSAGSYDVYFIAEDNVQNLQDSSVVTTIQIPAAEPIDPTKPGVTSDGVVLANEADVTMVITSAKVKTLFTNVYLPNMKYNR